MSNRRKKKLPNRTATRKAPAIQDEERQARLVLETVSQALRDAYWHLVNGAEPDDILELAEAYARAANE